MGEIEELAKGTADLRYLLTQHRVEDKAQSVLFKSGTGTVAKFSASFTSEEEEDIKTVLAKEFSIEPEASLTNRALAASFVVA